MSKIKDNGTLKDAHEFYKKNSAGTGLEYIEELYRKNSQGQLEKIFDAGWDTTVTSIPATLSNARAKPTSWEIKGKSQQRLLPDGYTQLEYIQSTVTTSYIDTGIYSKNITSAEIKFNLSNNNNYTGFGDTTVGTGSGYPASMWCENSAIKWYYSGGSAITLGSHNTDITATLPFPTQTAGSTVHIFHANGAVADKCVSGKYYYVRLLNGTNIVFNGIPAKDSNGVLGMYDTVTNTFFTNAGTGTFTAGPALPSPTSPVDVKGVGNSGLPSGYKKLEYIESVSDAYIDTGFKPNQDTKWEYKFKCNNLIDSVMAGARTGYGTKMYILGCTNAASVFGAGYGNTTTYLGVVTADLNDHIFIIDKNKWYFDGELRATMDTYTFQGDYNMYLFRGNNGGSATNTCSQRIYYSKIWDNGTLVRHFIPAKNPSNVIGMYDLVSDTFFTNAGTGSFIAGPEDTRDTSCVVPVKVSGKNLFNKTDTVKNYGIVKSTGLPQSDSACSCSNYIEVSPNSTYTISGATLSWSGYYGGAFYDENEYFISGFSAGNLTITTPDSAKYVRYTFHSTYQPEDGSQIELGSSATTYEPYFTPTTTNISLSAPLQKVGTYTDSIESDGTLTRGVGKLILTGTEDWTYSNNAIYARLVYANIPLYGLCSHFNYSTASIIAEMNDGEFIYNKSSGATNGNLSLKSSLFTDLSTAKSWLAAQYAAGTPVIIYYPLATATETTVQVPTISTVKGTNYLDIQTEVEPSSVSITYRKRTSA